MTEIIRVRDLIERKQRQTEQAPEVDGRAARLAENAKRHLAEINDSESWFSEQKVRDLLTNVHDCTPVEVQDVIDLLSVATHYTKRDFDEGWPIMQALATIRGEV